MSLADNFFGCAETPLWTPNMFDMSSIPKCTSCILRLTANSPGVGRLSATSSTLLTFEESPLTTLSVNGIQHNVVSSQLSFPGLHKI